MEGRRCARRWPLSRLPGQIPVKRLGAHRLKGLDRAETIIQIGDGEFASLRAPTAMISLPARQHALVGRDELLTAVDEALTAHRLVTLVGAGGNVTTAVRSDDRCAVGLVRTSAAAGQYARSGAGGACEELHRDWRFSLAWPSPPGAATTPSRSRTRPTHRPARTTTPHRSQARPRHRPANATTPSRTRPHHRPANAATSVAVAPDRAADQRTSQRLRRLRTTRSRR